MTIAASHEGQSAPLPPGAREFSRARMGVAAIGFLILAAASYAAAWTPLTELQIAVVRVTGALSILGLAGSAIAFAPVVAMQAGAVKIAVFGGVLAAGVASYATFPVASPARGTSGARLQFYIEGVMATRTGCEGDFYAAAAKPGSSGNTLMQTWLSEGSLNAAGGVGRAATYKGILRTDGSFRLTAVDASPAGDRESIVGRIGLDGSITATWDRIVGRGCVQHYKSTKGGLMSGAQLADLLRTNK